MFVSSGIRALDLRAMATNDGASGAQGAKVTEISPYSHPPPHSFQPSRPPDPEDVRRRLLIEREERLRILREETAAFCHKVRQNTAAFSAEVEAFRSEMSTSFREMQLRLSAQLRQLSPQPPPATAEPYCYQYQQPPPPPAPAVPVPQQQHHYHHGACYSNAQGYYQPSPPAFAFGSGSSYSAQPYPQPRTHFTESQDPLPQSGPLPTPASYYAHPPQPNLYQPPQQQQPQRVGNSHLFQYRTPSPPQLQDPPLFISVADSEEAKLTSSKCERDEADVPNGTTTGGALGSAPQLDHELVSPRATTPKMLKTIPLYHHLNTRTPIQTQRQSMSTANHSNRTRLVGASEPTKYGPISAGANELDVPLGPPPALGPVAAVTKKQDFSALAKETSKGRALALDGLLDDSGGFRTMKISISCLPPGLVLVDCAFLHGTTEIVEAHHPSVIVPESPRIYSVAEHSSQVPILNSQLGAILLYRNFIATLASRFLDTEGLRLKSSIACVITGDIEQEAVEFAAVTHDIAQFDSVLSPLWAHTTTQSGQPALLKYLLLNVPDTQVELCLSAALQDIWHFTYSAPLSAWFENIPWSDMPVLGADELLKLLLTTLNTFNCSIVADILLVHASLIGVPESSHSILALHLGFSFKFHLYTMATVHLLLLIVRLGIVIANPPLHFQGRKSSNKMIEALEVVEATTEGSPALPRLQPHSALISTTGSPCSEYQKGSAILFGQLVCSVSFMISFLESGGFIKATTVVEFLFTSGTTHIQVHALTALPLKFERHLSPCISEFEVLGADYSKFAFSYAYCSLYPHAKSMVFSCWSRDMLYTAPYSIIGAVARNGDPHHISSIQKLISASRHVILNVECGISLLKLERCYASDASSLLHLSFLGQ